MHLCKNPDYHERTKHNDVKYRFTRENVPNGNIDVIKITIKDNPVNFGTKIVTIDKFDLCRDLLHINEV